jgi:hypothetical protein
MSEDNGRPTDAELEAYFDGKLDKNSDRYVVVDTFAFAMPDEEWDRHQEATRARRNAVYRAKPEAEKEAAATESVVSVDSVVHPKEREWGEVLLGKMPPPGKFPIDIFPSCMVAVAKAIARAVGCDLASVGGTMLAIGGGIIGRTVHLRLMENWIVPPIIFHANVAEPGQGKTWANRYLTGPLNEIEATLRAQFQQEKAEYQALLKANPKGGYSKPIPSQFLIDDATMESVFQVIANNPRGCLAVRDELPAMFDGMNQYKGGKGSDRSTWLKLWAGEPIAYNRVKNEFGEPLYIPYPHLSLTGNIPPDKLRTIVGGHGKDGMLDRFCFTYPDWQRKLKFSERTAVSSEILAGWKTLLDGLWALKLEGKEDRPHPHMIDLANDGRNEFASRYDAHVDEWNHPSFPSWLRGPWAKLETYAGRFALILHTMHQVVSRANDWSDVGVPTVDGAWKLVDYFKGEHRRILAVLQQRGESGLPDGARLILNWIRNHSGTKQFSERDIHVTYNARDYEPQTLVDGFRWLQGQNVIRPAIMPPRAKGTPGRKPSPEWEINPSFSLESTT